MRFLITNKWSVKISYSEMKQYLHFLTSNTLGMPTDLWLPATDIIVPKKSTQIAAGTSISLNDKTSLVVEGYYKDMTNLVELKEGESVFGDFENGVSMSTSWENKVEQGIGWAYGAEILRKKDIGKLNGWVGYTLSWSNRKFENISFGQVFPYRYDTRHQINIVGIYKFSDELNVGITWIYSSGTPVTLSQLQYTSLQNSFSQWDSYYRTQYFGKRNNYRLPAYHRLDIGLNWSKENKWGHRTWSFGVYNAYNHLNPFYVDLNSHNLDNVPTLTIYSLFPLILSISYKLEF